MQDRFKTIDHEKRPRGSNIVRVSSFFDRDTGKPAPASDTQYKHALRQGEDPGVISRIRERATMPDRDKAGAQAVVEMAAREAGMSPGDYVDNRLGALNAHQTLPGTINEMAHALPRGFVESLTALPDSISPGDDEDPESFAQRLFPNNPDYQHNLLVLGISQCFIPQTLNRLPWSIGGLQTRLHEPGRVKARRTRQPAPGSFAGAQIKKRAAVLCSMMMERLFLLNRKKQEGGICFHT